MKCYNITKINWFEIMFMLFYKNILTLSILAAVSVTAFAAENEKVESLETIRIKAHPF